MSASCIEIEPFETLLSGSNRYLILATMLLGRTRESELFVVREATSAADLNAVKKIEREVFEEFDYVSTDEYVKYEAQSTFFGAFNAEMDCLGMMRLIAGGPLTPPVLSDAIELDASRARWQSLADDGLFCELACTAISPKARRGPVLMSLANETFRHAKATGHSFAGTITDPRIAAAYQRICRIKFEQVGPLQHYMDEPMLNAPYVIDLRESANLDFKLETKPADFVAQAQPDIVLDLTEPRG